ncbi:MAG: citrate/2-methylcitrate synthase [Phycisphaerales bacterium]|jgi:citrate synthase|nr:citrate/2-methylcitrate synthase [Phycisphaerales bacterium]
MSTATEKQFDQGLVNTIAAETQMSFIDGEKGVLEYVGIDIDSLARHSTFEESTFLLWNGRLPNPAELTAFEAELRAEYALPEGLIAMIRETPADASTMHVVQTLVSALSLFDPECDDDSPEANIRKAIRLVAKTPTLIAAFDRHRKGKEIIPADSNRSIAGNFLWMLRGEEPTETMVRALDVCLVLHADHGFNASTFTSLVVISTLSDLYSACSAAVGALRGPLHGGANEGVMVMLNEIGDMSKVDGFMQGKLERKEKIMGFGHRVYKAYDPRATYLKTFAEGLAGDTGNLPLYEMSKRIEEIMHEAVADKGIFPNVDFYSATTYWSLGLELDLFTPMFALSRMSGWTGHCIEYLKNNKLIRPGAAYVGPHEVPYVALEDR